MNVNIWGGNLRTFTRDKNLDIVKGIGILLIILHNYFHTFPEFPPECEFKYAPENVSRFTEAMLSGNLRIIILSLFSFLGHYGVSIFVFVSGYGLSKRYDHSGESKWYIICAEPYNCGNGSFLWRYCLFSTVIRGIRILPMPIWVITRFGPTCCLCLLLRPTALPTDLSLPGRGGISAWHFSCMLFTHYSCGNHRTRFYGVL